MGEAADNLSLGQEAELPATPPAAIEPRPRHRRARRTKTAHEGVKIIEQAHRSGSASSSWVARWRDPDSGRPAQTSLDALGLRTAEARRAWAITKSKALAKRRAALAAGAVPHSERDLAKAVKDYIDHSKKTKRESTVGAMTPALARFLEWAEKRGLNKTDDVRPHDLAAFREDLTAASRSAPQAAAKRGTRRTTAKPLSRVSVNSYLKAIKACLNWLRRTGLLAHVASEEQVTESMRSVRVPKEDPEILTAAEVRALLRACLTHDEARWSLTRNEHDGLAPAGSTTRYTALAPFVAFLLLTGCRLGEALSLDWRDVELDALDDQGRSVGSLRITAAKSKTHASRTVGLEVSPGLRSLLRAMRLRAGGQGRVFAAFSESAVKRALERLVRPVPAPGARQRAAGFGAPVFAWHTLRRTCGTFLVCSPSIYGSAAVFLAAKQLGHSIAVAEESYLNRVRGIAHGLTTLDDVLGIADLLALVHRAAGGDADQVHRTAAS